MLNGAERLKCRLSDPQLPEQTELEEQVVEGGSSGAPVPARTGTPARGAWTGRRPAAAVGSHTHRRAAPRRDLSELDGVVAVGAVPSCLGCAVVDRPHGSRPLLTPPPVEAVALGALSLTPGVSIRDVLQHGVSIRTWDPRSQRHQWHPLFVAGQPGRAWNRSTW